MIKHGELRSKIIFIHMNLLIALNEKTWRRKQGTCTSFGIFQIFNIKQKKYLVRETKMDNLV